MDAAKKSLSGSRKIMIGNQSKMKQGKAMDSYLSRYKAKKPMMMTGKPSMKSSKGDSTMSQINKMTKGSY